MIMNEKQEMISGMILSYLQKNPDARDTLEGIVKWWLEVERIESSVDEVADALESLVQREIIRIEETKSGTTFYGINKENEFVHFHN